MKIVTCEKYTYTRFLNVAEFSNLRLRQQLRDPPWRAQVSKSFQHEEQKILLFELVLFTTK